MTGFFDDEGNISVAFERCLREIFAKYCRPPPENGQLAVDAYMTADGLDKWAKDTNGEVFSQETKEEILEFLDVKNGNLTLEGFLQIYQLQAENDEEETWKDLEKHGYGRSFTIMQS